MKEFIVTNEILDIFKDKAVSLSNIKKYIPNYLDYQESRLEIIEKEYLPGISEKLEEFLTKKNIMTADEFSSKIFSILEDEGVIKDREDEIFIFDGSNYDMNVYSSKSIIVKEDTTYVLQEIAKSIKEAKKIKEESEVSLDILRKIANNSELMNKLNELKEFK